MIQRLFIGYGSWWSRDFRWPDDLLDADRLDISPLGIQRPYLGGYVLVDPLSA